MLPINRTQSTIDALNQSVTSGRLKYHLKTKFFDKSSAAGIVPKTGTKTRVEYDYEKDEPLEKKR